MIKPGTHKQAIALLCMVSGLLTSTLTAGELSLTLKVNGGLEYEDVETTDNDVSVKNFGSGLDGEFSQVLSDSVRGLGGFQIRGANKTRILRLGVSGSYGTLYAGTQYGAFYNAVSQQIDIAWWGSCWTEQKCDVESDILSYEREHKNARFFVSYRHVTSDKNNEIQDDFEVGARYKISATSTLGISTSFKPEEGQNKAGFLYGIAGSGELGPINLSLALQHADQDYVNSQSSETQLTLTGIVGKFYGILNRGDGGDDDTYYGTLGHEWNISPNSLIYTEIQHIDGDGEGTILRAVYNHKFLWEK